MKWYMLRNQETNQEIRMHSKASSEKFIEQGYEMVKVIDLKVGDKERKAK
jgi:hypothetical protein